MKKVLFALAMMLMLSFTANAQADGFLNGNSSNDEFRGDVSGDETHFILPQAHGREEDQGATPVGSGLLILTALGAAYALKNKR